MNFNFEKEETVYKMINGIKASGPGGKSFIEAGVLFNQKVLTACGKIHATLLQLDPDAAEKFKADNKEFFESFAWVYYTDWQKTKAKSLAHCLSMYKLLNVKLGVDDCVGETFYAGIPMTTAAEINEAVQTCQVAEDGVTPIGPEDDGFCHEKIGIDGQLHKTDQLGEFEPWASADDIYNDGSMVSTEDLQEFNKEPEEEPESWTDCYTCAHMGGDGKICEECEGWK